MTLQEIADKSAATMWDNDSASQWMGMTLIGVAEGAATMALRVETHHCNGHGMCHGGIIFSLADSAFAFACNSRNQATVAQNNMITFVKPAQLGDTLTATAQEVSLTGRSGIYDVQVCDQDGRVIAEMRGLSRAIKGTVFPA